MSYTLVQKEFFGPLELLLELIETREKQITDVALAEVTEDFLKYVDSHEAIRPDELADFLVVAAKLLFLKSRALLPVETAPEENEISLEEQLRLYKEFVEAARFIEDQWNHHRVAYGRPVKFEYKKGFYPPEHLAQSELAALVRTIVERLEYFKRLPERALARVMSIKEKIQVIRDFLKQSAGRSTLRAVLGGRSEKHDLIVSFLALLELVKQKEITLRQGALFDDIHIEKHS